MLVDSILHLENHEILTMLLFALVLTGVPSLRRWSFTYTSLHALQGAQALLPKLWSLHLFN